MQTDETLTIRKTQQRTGLCMPHSKMRTSEEDYPWCYRSR